MKRPLTIEELNAIKRLVATHLEVIEETVCEPEAFATCIIRHPGFRDGYLIVTRDRLDGLRDVVCRAIEKGDAGEVPP